MTTAPQVCCACKSGFVVLGIGALVVSQQSSLKGKISGVSVCRVDLVPQGACRFQSSAREPVICGPCVSACGSSPQRSLFAVMFEFLWPKEISYFIKILKSDTCVCGEIQYCFSL